MSELSSPGILILATDADLQLLVRHRAAEALCNLGAAYGLTPVKLCALSDEAFYELMKCSQAAIQRACLNPRRPVSTTS